MNPHVTQNKILDLGQGERTPSRCLLNRRERARLEDAGRVGREILLDREKDRLHDLEPAPRSEGVALVDPRLIDGALHLDKDTET